ncbi:MAG TPA: TrpB-like pyridoxal phosphate-dependent enzyme [Candidatus Brocadiia bacterium]|nr:TrpB-like pyridoxal phosphate-dependent enzyme [Candidatus Brocadiia bacterium]
MSDKKILMAEKDMPQRWYNIQADLPNPLPPPIHPGTKQPIGPEMLAPIFPMGLIKQEVTTERWIDIPDPIMEALRIWRPTPLVRAERLEKALGTPARIYYKNESVSPAGSHKPNTAVAQVYYNKIEGVKRITTETGAGQWGSALSFACNVFGVECKIYMVRVSYEQKPYRKMLMHCWGGNVVPSPSPDTEFGRKVLAETPDTPGSLGIAITEAVEDAVKRDDTKYSLGSVLNHVLLHQTVVGLETKEQLKIAGDKADILIGCVGGGSNFAGLAFPFVPDKLKGQDMRIIAVEPTACPSVTRGEYRYDFGDTGHMTPLLKMFTLGHTFIPSGIHAGGLRYHGMAPLVSLLAQEKIIEAAAYRQNPVFKSAVLFARTEGAIPAPETAHAIHCAVEEALRCKAEGKAKTIVFNFSGHGHFDMASYERYFEGKLEDYEHPEAAIRKAMADVPEVP